MNKFLLIMIVVIALIIASFLLFNEHEKKSGESILELIPNSSEFAQIQPSKIIYNLAEVSKHASKEDCWTVIDNKVYNLSPYIELNMHSPTILYGCGKDSTQIFNSRHSSSAKRQLNDYYLAELSI